MGRPRNTALLPLLAPVAPKEARKAARPLCSMAQRDKLTTAWLLSLPGGQSSLTTPIFREGMAMALCLPSPACKDRVGERIGGAKVDLCGDRVLCEGLPGNGWVIRHDRTKMEIMRMLGWSGVVATCEVTGLFQHLIPPAARDRPGVKAQSHVMVPDYRIQLPSTTPGQLHNKRQDCPVVSSRLWLWTGCCARRRGWPRIGSFSGPLGSRGAAC
jgi:hypothetical protein